MRAAVASLSAPDLRGGARLLWMGSLVAMFLLLWEAPRQPLLVLLVPVVCVGVILAVRSPAWPLGVITGSILISLLLYGHLPKGGTVAACVFAIELSFLPGRAALAPRAVESVLVY